MKPSKILFISFLSIVAAMMFSCTVPVFADGSHEKIKSPIGVSYRLNPTDLLLSLDTGTTLVIKPGPKHSEVSTEVEFIDANDFSPKGMTPMGEIPVVLDTNITYLNIWMHRGSGKNKNKTQIYIDQSSTQKYGQAPMAVHFQPAQVDKRLWVFNAQSENTIGFNFNSLSFNFQQLNVVVGYDEQTTIYNESSSKTLDLNIKERGPFISFDLKL